MVQKRLKDAIHELRENIDSLFRKAINADNVNLVGPEEDFVEWVGVERLVLKRFADALDSMSEADLRAAAMFVALEIDIFWKIKMLLLEQLCLYPCGFDARDGPGIVDSFKTLAQMFDPTAGESPSAELVFNRIVVVKERLERGFKRIHKPWEVRLVMPIDANVWPEKSTISQVYDSKSPPEAK